ncbi:UNVERIFIED_CONTAM: hypothetical protein PYX00_005036 [Menopon gallinae]|uniref:Uncharacterized protein n=1 Tax=Menopon gallinae TaxID=328185 RepID=A0AAW2I736_9NEOP
MQTGEYHRENGLNLRENGMHLRENGLHLREDELRENGGNIENNLKLRLTNGHGNYDIAKITSNRHPISNGYAKHEYMGNPEDVKHYEASNPPSPNLDPQNSPESERKVNKETKTTRFFRHGSPPPPPPNARTRVAPRMTAPFADARTHLSRPAPARTEPLSFSLPLFFLEAFSASRKRRLRPTTVTGPKRDAGRTFANRYETSI